jgi:hypothetical protein
VSFELTYGYGLFPDRRSRVRPDERARRLIIHNYKRAERLALACRKRGGETTAAIVRRAAPREPRPRSTTRTTRTGSRSPPDNPGSDEPSPEAPPKRSVGGASDAPSRLWAHVRRREAKAGWPYDAAQPPQDR